MLTISCKYVFIKMRRCILIFKTHFENVGKLLKKKKTIFLTQHNNSLFHPSLLKHNCIILKKRFIAHATIFFLLWCPRIRHA